MGQILKPDNIPNIVVGSATTITLAATNAGQPARITIGGQQYTPPTILSLSTAIAGAGGLDTGTIAANSTYYVYAVLSGGNLALVASLTGVSTGPTGFVGYTFVGLFDTLDNTTSIDFAVGVSPTEPGKNYIINGAMDFWQRGTTFNPGTSVSHVADRFAAEASGSPVYSRSTDVPNSACPYSLQIASGTTYAALGQRIEAVNIQHLAGQTVTFSAYIKGSITGNLPVRVHVPNTTDTWSSSDYGGLATAILISTVPITTVWSRISVSLVLPASVIRGLAIGIGNFDGSYAGQLNTTGWMLTEGADLVPFKRHGDDLGAELAACQRYFQKFGGHSAYEHIGWGIADSANNVTLWLPAKTTLRTGELTYTINGVMGAYRARGNGVEVTDFTTITPPGTTIDSENSPCVIVGKTAAFGLNLPYAFFSDNDVSGWIGVSAEL